MTLSDFYKVWNDGCDTLVVHTSGSTGPPKSLLVEKRRMVASAKMTCDFLCLKKGDTALLCMSLDYIAGKMMAVRALVRGLRLVEMEPTGHPMADEAVRHLHFDLAAMVPLQVYNTLQVPEEKVKLMQVRHLLIGGGPLDERLEKELRLFPNHVWATYGMTETLSHVAMRKVNGEDASPWFEPMPGVELSVNNDNCLVVNAPQVCEEILTTRDIVEMHPDGKRFKVVGRVDNVACCGGLKIQLEKVEELLLPHLRQPFLIAKEKDEKFGEILVLVVEGEPHKEIEGIVDNILPLYWKPKKTVFVKQLPMTETGKPIRIKRIEW